MVAISLLIARQQGWLSFLGTILPTQVNSNTQSQVKPELGPRHKLNYQQWVDILKQEAKVASVNRPQRLTILAGDSLSLWFPFELLPLGRNWLNQGISGETSAGLLKRLDLFKDTQPETIFVMVGINDLIRGLSNDTILQNYWQIMRQLRKMHPKSQIVVQSILPHAEKQATWEGREKLVAIPNSRIRELNQRLEAIAKEEEVRFLNLYPLFADKQGNLRSELSTDGLHLNSGGYLVWSSALELYTQLELEP
jgi:lysophospholipase L1-like esterase